MPDPGGRKIRLIGADLDNTLLNSEKKLTDYTKRVLETCMEKGIVFAPATGRAKRGIPQQVRELKGLRYALLANGAAVIDLENDEYIYRNGISFEKALSLVRELDRYDTYYDFFAEGAGWCEGRFFDHPEKYRIDHHIIDLVRASRKRIDSMEDWLMAHGKQVEKFTMFFADEKLRQEVLHDLSKDSQICVTSSLSNNLEINHFSCNKGQALLALGSHLGIPAEEIMAFGDGYNDLEMIRMAGLGVAMENSVPELLKAADYITFSCDQDGVGRAAASFALGMNSL